MGPAIPGARMSVYDTTPAEDAHHEAVCDLHAELLDTHNDDLVSAAYAAWVAMQDGENAGVCLAVIETMQAAMTPAERRVLSNARRLTVADVDTIAARHARRTMSITDDLARAA